MARSLEQPGARRHRSLWGALAATPALVLAVGALAATPAERCSLSAPAIVELTRSLESGAAPQDIQAALHHRRGLLFQAHGYDRRALDDFNAALELAPDLAEGYLNRGVLYADQAQYRLAIADLDRAIGIQPDLAEAYVRRGEAWYEIGDYPSAIGDFTAAVGLDAGGRAYLGRANALRDSGAPEPALADYAQAIRLSPRDAETWFQRAIAQHRLDRFEAERADWTTAIELDPGLFWRYGTIYRHRHLYEELRSDHRTALQHEPDGAKAYFSRAEAQRYRHHYCQAIQDYTAAIDLGYVRAHLGRGIAHYALGAYDEAIGDLSVVLQRRSAQVDAYFYRGLAYHAQGLAERARADFADAHRLSPFNPVVRAAQERSQPTLNPD